MRQIFRAKALARFRKLCQAKSKVKDSILANYKDLCQAKTLDRMDQHGHGRGHPPQ